MNLEIKYFKKCYRTMCINYLLSNNNLTCKWYEYGIFCAIWCLWFEHFMNFFLRLWVAGIVTTQRNLVFLNMKTRSKWTLWLELKKLTRDCVTIRNCMKVCSPATDATAALPQAPNLNAPSDFMNWYINDGQQ